MVKVLRLVFVLVGFVQGSAHGADDVKTSCEKGFRDTETIGFTCLCEAETPDGKPVYQQSLSLQYGASVPMDLKPSVITTSVYYLQGDDFTNYNQVLQDFSSNCAKNVGASSGAVFPSLTTDLNYWVESFYSDNGTITIVHVNDASNSYIGPIWIQSCKVNTLEKVSYLCWKGPLPVDNGRIVLGGDPTSEFDTSNAISAPSSTPTQAITAPSSTPTQAITAPSSTPTQAITTPILTPNSGL